MSNCNYTISKSNIYNVNKPFNLTLNAKIWAYNTTVNIITDLSTVVIDMSAITQDDSPLTYTINKLPDHGNLSKMNNTLITAIGTTIDVSSVKYMPTTAGAYSDNFRFNATDGKCTSNNGIISITRSEPLP